MSWWRYLLMAAAVLTLMAVALLWLLLQPVKLAPGITLIRPALASLGANIVVHDGNNGRTVVDSQLPVLAALTSLRVGQLGAADRVVLTHWHPDHSGGYANFAGAGEVLAHAGTVDKLRYKQTARHLTAPGSVHEFPARAAAQLPGRLINPAATTGDSVTVGDAEIFPFTRAHSNADLAVWFARAKVMAVGDLLWPGSFPFVDSDGGGSVSGLLAALDVLLEISPPDALFIPGHGEPMTLSAVREYRSMVATSAAAVRCAADSGAPAAAVLHQWAQWSSSLVPQERWLEMVLQDPHPVPCVNAGVAPHPAAPAQLQQFAFLLGEHVCADVLTDLQGNRQELAARWTGRYVLGGFGIQDSYANSLFHATNIRTYNEEEGLWYVTYFREPGGISGTWKGTVSATGAVLERAFDYNGQPTTSRLTFTRADNNGFSWQSEYQAGAQTHVDWRSTCERQSRRG